jgi:hypothetical protein
MRHFIFCCLLSFLTISPVCAQEKGATRVVMIGNGIGEGKEGVDTESFAKLLVKVGEQMPDVVFFTGNLIHDLEQSTSPESINNLKNQLDKFTRLTRQYLGDKPKLYPVIGNHTFVNSRAVQLFIEHFGLTDTAPLEPYQLAYAVKVQHVQFIVLASGLFERSYRGYLQWSRRIPLLDWLEKELRTQDPGITYRFVISHLPAFSSRSTEGMYTGLDADLPKRDAFWNVLKNNGALAYFSSHEPIYDRSHRQGVWQIISGGVGAHPENDGTEAAFQHFILITIPEDQKKNPVLEAIDLDGKVWDKFEIVPIDRPVHQLRISNQG